VASDHPSHTKAKASNIVKKSFGVRREKRLVPQGPRSALGQEPDGK
jgi:hypothetical protein